MTLLLAISFSYAQSAGMQHLTVGVNYAAQGKFEEAREEFGKVSEADPLYEFVGETRRVVEDVIDRKIKSKTAIHLFKGAAYALKGQWDHAITEYNKAIEINPRFAMAYRTRGSAYSKRHQYEEAIADFNKAIELNPRLVTAYLERGRTYMSGKGQLDQAISDFSKTIELNPRFAQAYYNRGNAYYHKGEYDKAWEDVHKLQSLGYQVHPNLLNALREASGRQE